MEKQFRPVAVPLVTVDPYFSVWSMSENLMYDHTRHWTGVCNGMVGMLEIDGRVWRFLGRKKPDSSLYETKFDADGMEQKSVIVNPLSSIYVFEADGVRLELSFTTPLLMDDLDLLSRPASYIGFKVTALDNASHKVKLYFDVTGEWCVNTCEQKVVWGRKNINDKIHAMYMGMDEQRVLNSSGDNRRIDWGYFYMAFPATNKSFIKSFEARDEFLKTGNVTSSDDDAMPRKVNDKMPVMGTVLDFGNVTAEPIEQKLVLAYDDIYSIEYFGTKLAAYWKRNGSGIEDIISKAFEEYDVIMKKCSSFGKKLLEDAADTGGEKYAQLLSLAYRQAIAAHKLVLDEEGKVLFLSKECFSNGCIGTVDVSYPSIPLFLLFNPELVAGMLRPIFKYAKSDEWTFEFAPHDIGQYPLANGQVYWKVDGKLVEKGQMPVEECGNMIIMTAVLTLMQGDTAMARENWYLLEKWVKYLLAEGLDPAEQLCTDDFAGRLAHNTNLSIKAIIGIGCFSILAKLLGKEAEAATYYEKAKEMAGKWELMAREEDHYKLTFNTQNSWSLKYNLIWDKLLDLNLFDEKISEREVAYYLKKKNRYGTPLDSRRAFTKSDWLVWAASLADTKDKFESLIEPIWDMVNESLTRTPFTDYYGTMDGMEREFQNRSVIGGIFIKLLIGKGIMV